MSSGTSHGTKMKYYGGCRCELCVATHKYYLKALRKQRRERWAKPVPDRVHGTQNGYNNYGCRCDPCKAAGAEHNRQRASRTLVPRS